MRLALLLHLQLQSQRHTIELTAILSQNGSGEEKDSSSGAIMPRKRPLETRISELESRMERLKLEKAIRDMRDKIRMRQPRRRRR
jgi:hypothetical protein